jgi:plasmid stabilization system protein ParE
VKKYTLSYLPIFDADLSKSWEYIAFKLKNPTAADRLVRDTEEAILKRLKAPESSEQFHSDKEREHPYYRIYIRNFTVWYVVIDNVMEVRRFLYNKMNAEKFL